MSEMARRTWSSVVESLRTVSESERFRLAMTRGVRGWREFVIAWPQVAGSIPAEIAKLPAPDASLGFDQLLAWAWDAAEVWSDAAVAAIDARLPFSTYQTMSVFVSLRGAALIFPDGAVSRPLLDRLTRAEALRDVADAMTQQRQAEYIESARRAAAEAAKKKEKAAKASEGAAA